VRVDSKFSLVVRTKFVEPDVDISGNIPTQDTALRVYSHKSRIVCGLDAQQGDNPFCVQSDGCEGGLVWGDVVPRYSIARTPLTTVRWLNVVSN
jgi:hypothetical protein